MHTSIDNSREIIKSVLSKPDTYAIVPKCEGRAVGCVGLKIGEHSNLDIPENEGEIGYWIGVPFWGQGLIPEAVNRMLCYGFEERRLTKIWCGYFKGNENSRRVQEKCGFRHHHTNENMPWPLMGDVRTMIISCLTLEQWKKDILIIANQRRP